MTEWQNFEQFSASTIGCPRQCGPLALYPPSFPALDAYCQDCGAQVQIKKNSKSTKETHASSHAAFRKAVKKHKASNIFFIIGTQQNWEIHNLKDRRLIRSWVRTYRPSSKSVQRKTGIVSIEGMPVGFANWTEVAKAFGLMIQQKCTQVTF